MLPFYGSQEQRTKPHQVLLFREAGGGGGGGGFLGNNELPCLYAYRGSNLESGRLTWIEDVEETVVQDPQAKSGDFCRQSAQKSLVHVHAQYT